MRFIILALLAAWVLGMAALFAFGLYGLWLSLASIPGGGSPATFNGHVMSRPATLVADLWFFGCYLSFAGGSVMAGIDWIQRMRRQGVEPGSYHPAPRVRGDRVIVKEPYWYFLLFAALIVVFAGGHMIAMSASVAGLEDLATIAAVGSLFIFVGLWFLHRLLDRVEFDMTARTWRACKGLSPFRSVECGPLSDASCLILTQETREHDEGVGSYAVLVVRLAWRGDDRLALHLTEAVVKTCWGESDGARGIERWARSLAERLGLPVEGAPAHDEFVGELA